ncbi:MAG: L,D-transpeptidase [Pseudomonadota bacterium]
MQFTKTNAPRRYLPCLALAAAAIAVTSASASAASATATRIDATVSATGATLEALPVRPPHAAEKRAALLRAFGTPALDYLEGLKGKRGFKAPSELDPRFTLAFFVNTKARGPQAQRMWILQRDTLGGEWRMGLWDERLWRRRGLPRGITPPYSWPVSTGRKYPGDRKSGPTPTGVFTIDERKWRMAYGTTAPGMINVTYIDLHYSSGRRSGVAFHGTTRGRYRKLGRIDSHGCIRMTQSNARALLDRLRGRDGVLSDNLRWGSVPRFWQRERGGTRWGYTRDGAMHPVRSPVPAVEREVDLAGLQDANRANDATETTASVDSETTFPSVLTKQGYRAIVVMFQD